MVVIRSNVSWMFFCLRFEDSIKVFLRSGMLGGGVWTENENAALSSEKYSCCLFDNLE